MADVVVDGGGSGAPSVSGDPGFGVGSPAPPEGGTPLSNAAEPPKPVVVPPKADAPPPKPVVPAPKAPTIADTPAVDPNAPKPATPATWPEDWRNQMAGENKKAQDRLARFKSPTDIVNSYLALEQKLSAGEYAKKLPTNYTDQELADYRKANNIPENPDGYDVNLPGIVWGEADKPMVDSWKKFAHENNLPPELAKIGPAWYAREQEALVERLSQSDMENYQSGVAALQAEWGQEFRGNLNAAKNLFEGHPGVWEFVVGSRDSTGMRNGDNPTVLKALAQIAREANPYASVLPSAPGKSPQESLAEEKASIKAKMGDKGSEYWRGPSAPTLQARYREILELEQRMSGRAA